jgi:serine/threonine-protein kinase
MVLSDGTLKLTDFGIAKDTDVTQLTSANCTVGTAAYMSPEQCKGDRCLTYKSDLYSLGVLLYELITGRKPFVAENAMEMFLLHVQGTFPRPAKLVLELPVWLDNLICQLLEKKPEQRPLDAAMVHNVLGSVKEKVESQQSAGLEAARRRMVDRPAGAAKPDEKDKEAARFLLKGKVRGRRKPGRPFYEKAWFQAAGLLAILSAVGVILWIVFRPPSADKLYGEAERLMKSGNDDKRHEARNGPIREYLRLYGFKLADDPRTKEMQQAANDVDRGDCEYKLQRHLKKRGDKLNTFPPDGPTEEKAFKAADNEVDGDPKAARAKWMDLKDDQMRGWQLTAERHLLDLSKAEEKEKDLKEKLKAILKLGTEWSQAGEMEGRAFRAVCYEQFGDFERAAKSFKDLKKETEEATDQQRPWFLLAARKVKEIEDEHRKQPDREELIKKQLAVAKDLKKKDELMAARGTCLTIMALYGGDKEDDGVKELAAQVRGLLKDIAERLPAK